MLNKIIEKLSLIPYSNKLINDIIKINEMYK